MKKITFLFLAAFLTLSINLQAQSAVDKIFNKYSDKAGFTSVTMNKYMFEMISRMDTSAKGKDFSKAVSQLESIRILATDSVTNLQVNLYDEAMKALPAKDYKELMTVKDKGTNVKFMILEKGDIVTELILISGGKNDNNALIVIKGQIDLASIGSIARNLKIDGLEPLEKLNEHKK